MFVEGGSGRVDNDPGEMSELDLAAARARGKSPEQWMKMSRASGGSSRRGAVRDSGRGEVLEEI